MESDVAMDDELSGVVSGNAGLDEEPSHAKNTSDMAARYAKIFFIIPPLFFFNLVLVITLLLPAVFFGRCTLCIPRSRMASWLR